MIFIKNTIWILKLSVLTLSIFWFITDGFTTSASKTFGINLEGRETPEWLVYILIAYLIFSCIRSIYNKNINKPKDDIYKKYRELQ